MNCCHRALISSLSKQPLGSRVLLGSAAGQVCKVHDSKVLPASVNYVDSLVCILYPFYCNEVFLLLCLDEVISSIMFL